jgi:hypothetical protein
MPRPKKKVDPATVQALARIGCTWEEIAGVLQISKGTLSARMKEKKYRDAYDQGIAEGDVSLRRAQYNAAIAGRTAMMIWLGKNRLNQTDRVEGKLDFELRDGSEVISRLLTRLDDYAGRETDGA